MVIEGGYPQGGIYRGAMECQEGNYAWRDYLQGGVIQGEDYTWFYDRLLAIFMTQNKMNT